MKTLNWIYMSRLEGKIVTAPTVTLIERLEEEHLLLVWGICYKAEGESLYQPVVRSPDRKYLRTIPERLSLEDAKEAIEKKLLDDGVLQEGDTINDYLDP